ncbi:MAG: DUF4252 domain-containing protein [Bacteroidota bacterium]
MNRIISAIAVVFVSTTLFSQQVVSKYMDRFENDETFTKVSVSSKMFSLFSELEGSKEDEQLFYDITSKLKGMKVVASDKVAKPKELYMEAVKDVEKSGFEELMTVKDAEENVKISIIEKNGTISELVLVVGGKEQFALVSLFGEINLKEISKLASLMRVSQLKYLDNLEQAID